MQRYKHSLRPNIYECKICHEHYCDHELDEDEAFGLFPITLSPPAVSKSKQNHNGIAEMDEEDITIDSIEESSRLDNEESIDIATSSKSQDLKK